MLTVDPARRASVDECLAHPWLTRRPFDARAALAAAHATAGDGAAAGAGAGLGDSSESLTGAMGRLDFTKRKPARERTLLSALNDVKVSMVIGEDGTPVEGAGEEAERRAGGTAVKVFEKNAREARQTERAKGKSGGKGKEEGEKAQSNGKGKTVEERPAEKRETREFMQMGGKGDQPLYGYDGESKYP